MQRSQTAQIRWASLTTNGLARLTFRERWRVSCGFFLTWSTADLRIMRCGPETATPRSLASIFSAATLFLPPAFVFPEPFRDLLGSSGVVLPGPTSSSAGQYSCSLSLALSSSSSSAASGPTTTTGEPAGVTAARRLRCLGVTVPETGAFLLRELGLAGISTSLDASATVSCGVAGSAAPRCCPLVEAVVHVVPLVCRSSEPSAVSGQSGLPLGRGGRLALSLLGLGHFLFGGHVVDGGDAYAMRVRS